MNDSNRYRGNPRLMAVLAAALLVACTGTPVGQIELMTAPDLYNQGGIDPFPAENPVLSLPYHGMLYATCREPATGNDSERYYTGKRGRVTRLGLANVSVGNGVIDWEEARRISLLKNRGESYPLAVTGVEELGVLENSIGSFDRALASAPDPYAPGKAFAQMVNAQLAQSSGKDVYVYVHGYKVVFENPVLVASELWHFLGYRGAFVAYAWPATPKRLAYLGDIETASYSIRTLRLLLEFLASETTAQRIHVIGYSAGTRVVLGALGELALQYVQSGLGARRLRLGNVILVGSDLDRGRFGGMLDDGMLNVVDRLSVYMSATDKALSMSSLLYTRERLGQRWQGDLPAPVNDFLREHPQLVMIDVSDAEEAASGNGHAYFRRSPWASSDILLTLYSNLDPQARGLVRNGDDPVWQFPDDYIQRLRRSLAEHGFPAPH